MSLVRKFETDTSPPANTKSDLAVTSTSHSFPRGWRCLNIDTGTYACLPGSEARRGLQLDSLGLSLVCFHLSRRLGGLDPGANLRVSSPDQGFPLEMKLSGVLLPCGSYVLGAVRSSSLRGECDLVSWSIGGGGWTCLQSLRLCTGCRMVRAPGRRIEQVIAWRPPGGGRVENLQRYERLTLPSGDVAFLDRVEGRLRLVAL